MGSDVWPTGIVNWRQAAQDREGWRRATGGGIGFYISMLIYRLGI